ncbi:MAG: hypothetical protein QOF30_3556 [Acidimicrobiaceae bacterium]|nr:hypothetical protein [Acidimicrobiaceae bacterium]
MRMDRSERRARLAVRHHLAPSAAAANPTDVARRLVALHSTDPASVYLACLARTEAGDTASVERALYDERSLVRMLGMRRTVFVVPVELAPVVHSACTRAIAALERRKLVQLLEQAGIAPDGAKWLSRVEDETMAALRERGQALGQELSEAVPDLRAQLSFGDETKKWAAVVAVTSRVLFVLAADGRIVRGKPRGSWISSQYRWVPRDDWLGEAPPEPPSDVARVELARRWLATFGPATPADLRWWTGWTAGDTKRALAELHPVEVDLDGVAGIVLPDDLAPTTVSAQPWAALLPALDPTVMGWSERSWFLGDQQQRADLFDRSGNAGPTVWWNGEVVGGWAQRRDGEVVSHLLRDIGADGRGAVDTAAQRLQTSVGEVRITPRFRTPIERELSA